MRTIDLLCMATHNLWTRRLRTLFNLVGVVIASVLLLVTLAASEGTKQAIIRFVENSEYARKFRVYPDRDRSVIPPEDQVTVEGEMSDRRRTRMRKLLEEKWRRKNQPRRGLIQNATLKKLDRLSSVVEVAPRYSAPCDILVDSQQVTTTTRSCSGLDTNLESRILFGNMLSEASDDQLLIHEGLAYELGFRSDADLKNLIGKQVTLHFPLSNRRGILFRSEFFALSISEQAKWIRVLEQLVSGVNVDSIDPQSLVVLRSLLRPNPKTEDPSDALVVKRKFTVCGVFRRRDDEDLQNVLQQLTGGWGDILIHHNAFEQQLHQLIPAKGVYQADVYVDQFSNLEKAIEECNRLNLRAIAPTGIVKRLIDGVDRIRSILTGIVVIVLFVSAIGIANTMLISIIERTEEIGILKSIGAKSRDVLQLILLEGLVTGILGGVIAMGVCLVIVTFGNSFLRPFVESRSRLQLTGSLFEIDSSMLMMTLAVSTITTTIAGLGPALRAAKIDPVVAMRSR